MLEWIHYVRTLFVPSRCPLESSRAYLLYQSCENYIYERSPIIFGEFCAAAVLCEEWVRKAAIRLGSLNSMEMRIWVAEAKWWPVITRAYVRMVTAKGNRIKAIIKIVWATEIRAGLLIVVSLELQQISKQLKPFLIGISGKALSLVNVKSDLNSRNRVTNSHDWGSSQAQTPFSGGEAVFPWGSTLLQQQFILCILPSVFSSGAMAIYQNDCALRKGITG